MMVTACNDPETLLIRPPMRISVKIMAVGGHVSMDVMRGSARVNAGVTLWATGL
jgi:hypothetical protein